MLTVGATSPADADVATGGSGRFLSAINWFEWGTDGQLLPNAGFSQTNSLTVGAQTLDLTCTVSNIAQTPQTGTALAAYRPGDFSGDGLDDLYNIGGTGANNQLVIGLVNPIDNNTVDFDIACTGNLGGQSVPIAGLVFADAEQMGGNEFIQATMSTPGTWRIIDRIRNSGCTADQAVTHPGGDPNALRIDGVFGCGTGPSAVGFMDGASSAHVHFHGGGKTAIALGVVVALEHGDAPQSYGDAAHFDQYGFSGGEVPPGGTTLFAPGLTLGDPAPPVSHLGTNVDPEDEAQSSATADGDDTTGNGVFGPADDEDAIAGTGPGVISVAPGTSYTLNGVACSGSGQIAGWIDWNHDGDFADPGERSGEVACDGSVDLAWTVPDGVLPSVGTGTFLRMRMADDPADIANPSGIARSGEAEDYQLQVEVPTMQLEKRLPGGRLSPDDQFTVALEQNGDQLSSTTTAGTNQSATTGTFAIPPGSGYTVTDAKAAGPTSFSSYVASIVCSNLTTGDPVTVTGSPPEWSLPDIEGDDRILCIVNNTPAAPALALDKRASQIDDQDGNGPDAGDTVTYTLVVSNIGNVALDPVSLTDGSLTGLVCPEASLDSAESMTCTAPSHTLTQAEVDSGALTNTATATGTAPDGTVVDAEDTVTVPIPMTRAVTLDKEASALNDVDGNGPDAGDQISFAFSVTNDGNVTLDPVTVEDPRVGPVDCPDGPLAPGASADCTPVTYAVTQADVDAGEFENTATATGVAPDGGQATSSDTTQTPVPSDPAISVAKAVTAVNDVDGTGTTTVGDTVDFAIAVANTGNVTLDPVTVADPQPGLTCPQTALAPADEMVCTLTYSVTQGDVDAGAVSNSATATGTAPDGGEVGAADDITMPIEAAPGITMTKTTHEVTDVDGNGHDPGDTIGYTFTVLNAGNTSLTGIAVSDSAVGPVNCPATMLAPLAGMDCTATYTLTQVDVDAGSVDNTATATGTPPTGPAVTSTDDATTNVVQAPTIVLEKTASDIEDPDGNGDDAGDRLGYTFTVTNAGNVTLTTVTVTDDTVGPVTCPGISLAPGASVECTTDSYLLTQADVNNGEVDNDATAAGTPPIGAPVNGSDQDTVPIATTRDIDLVKETGGVTDLDGNGPDPGDTIAFTFEVTDTGNTTLRGIDVVDPEVGDVICPETMLAPQETTTCTATYSLTQADIDAGVVENTATDHGTDPFGEVATATSSAVTPIVAGASITLAKSAGNVDDRDGNGVDAGDTIEYTFIVANTGAPTLSDIGVDDPALGDVSCQQTTLASGESSTCTAASYRLTQEDVDAGVVVNRATATGTPPSGGDVSDRATARVRLAVASSIGLDKHARLLDDDGDGRADPGEQIRYTFVVTNSGATTLHDVAVDDPLLAGAGIPVACAGTMLDPGEATRCHATYTVTTSDLDHTVIHNEATASARCGAPAAERARACGRIVSAPASADVPTAREAAPETPTNPDGPSGLLPDTGSPVGLGWILAGVALVLCGAALVRHSRAHQPARR